jgi:hypothetical protein
MSIAHELSSDIAAAVLAAEEGESRGDASERAVVVMEVHSTLRRLNSQYRRKAREASGDASDAPPFGDGTASGRR